MIKLIRADIYRILRGKALYITMAVLLVMNIIMVAATRAGGHVGITFSVEDGVVEMMPTAVSGMSIPHALAESMENFVFFLLPIIVVVAGAIFTHGTVKNDIATGMSRTKLYVSKLLLSAAVCLLMLVFYIGVAMIIATIVGGFGGPAPAGHWIGLLQIFSAQYLLLLSLISIGVFLAFTSKRTAVVNGAYIAFTLAPPMIFSLLAIANPSFMRYFDFDMLSNIMLLANLPRLETIEILRALGIAVFYLLATTIGGIALFRKAEIK